MSEYIEKRAKDANGRLEYFGVAEPGSATSAAKWRIIKYSYSGIAEVDKLYPNGSNANVFIWDNRTSYSYS